MTKTETLADRLAYKINVSYSITLNANGVTESILTRDETDLILSALRAQPAPEGGAVRAFSVSEMIVSEECYLDVTPDKDSAVELAVQHSVGFSILNRIRAAARETKGSAHTPPDGNGTQIQSSDGSPVQPDQEVARLHEHRPETASWRKSTGNQSGPSDSIPPGRGEPDAWCYKWKASGEWFIQATKPTDSAIAVIEPFYATTPSAGEARVISMRERAAKLLEDRAAYFERAKGYREWTDAARSYRAMASEVRALSPDQEGK